MTVKNKSVQAKCFGVEGHHMKNSSHARHFNMSDRLIDSIEEQILETWFNTPNQELTTCDEEITLKYKSILIYQVHVVNFIC